MKGSKYIAIVRPPFEEQREAWVYLCENEQQAKSAMTALRWRVARMHFDEHQRLALLLEYQAQGSFPEELYLQTYRNRYGVQPKDGVTPCVVVKDPTEPEEIEDLQRSLPYRRPAAKGGQVIVRRERWLRGESHREVPDPRLVVSRYDGMYLDIVGMSLRMRNTALGEKLSEESQRIEDALLRELMKASSVEDLRSSRLMDVLPYFQEVPCVAGMVSSGMQPLYKVLHFINSSREYGSGVQGPAQPSPKREELLKHYFQVYLDLELVFV
jgi:hypothetical protein